MGICLVFGFGGFDGSVWEKVFSKFRNKVNLVTGKKFNELNLYPLSYPLKKA